MRASNVPLNPIPWPVNVRPRQRDKAVPIGTALSFLDLNFGLRLVSRTRSTATTTAWPRTPATPPAAIVIASRSRRRTSATSRSKSSLSRGLRSNAIGRIEVRLILLVELLAIRLFQILSTLDQNGALV